MTRLASRKVALYLLSIGSMQELGTLERDWMRLMGLLQEPQKLALLVQA